MNLTVSQELGRRDFLKRAAAVSVAAPAVLAAVATELDAQAPAGQAPGNVIQDFVDIRRHENDHVALLVNFLGPQARPRPTFRNLPQPNLGAFFRTSQVLENTGCGAYVGGVGYITTPGIIATAAAIALIEGRHAGWLNTFLGSRITTNVFGNEQSFERGLTIQEVNNLVAPFVASLNNGPPLSFSTVQLSAQNDIAIVNFALALEFLEQEFYNINVPRFFGGQ